jgi:glutamine synthetase
MSPNDFNFGELEQWLDLHRVTEVECLVLGKHQLPRSLGEAVELLRNDRELAAVLGESFVTVYTEIKELEQAEFMKVISPWEREHLLLHV